MAEAFMEMTPTYETKKKTIKEIGFDILTRLRSSLGSDITAVSPSTELPASTTPSELPETGSSTSAVFVETVYDKTEFPSATTEKYFRDWESLNIEANPEIKEKIRKNIIDSEKEHQAIYEQAAESAGLTPELFKQKLQEKIESVVEKSNFFRATKVDVLDKVLNDSGRYKSQFETSKSNGCFDPSYRAQAEMRMFGFNEPSGFDHSSIYRGEGIPEEAVKNNNENRPIYGYFSDSEFGAINDEGTIPPYNSVCQYGEVNVKIKKNRAMQKATLTFQDSLGQHDWQPTPASKPHFVSMRIRDYDVDSVIEKIDKTSKTDWGSSYTEVQFHGQLRIDDIEVIYISTKNGLDSDEVEDVRRIYNKFKETHPESEIKLIEF